MKKLLAVMIGCALSGAAMSAAQQTFQELDGDKNGQISRAEADAATAGSVVIIEFVNLDTNQDGSLSETEYMAAASSGSGSAGSTGTESGADSSSGTSSPSGESGSSGDASGSGTAQ